MSVKLGIDVLANYSDVFNNKRIGLLTNNTGVNSQLQSTIDLLKARYNLVKLFAPEHGVRGDLQAGVHLDGYVDEVTQLPVESLYGATRRPTAEMLADIDIFAFDIQDVGSRFYTYLYSMAYVMQACAEHGKHCVVFDRPNPMGAEKVAGNILDEDYKSFIGLYPIPQRHGLTIGEAALLFNTEYNIHCELTVIPMENYTRTLSFEETGLPWVLPSPNIPTVLSCFAFNATCIFEGTNVSEGRGTTKPFHFVGAPWIDANKLTEALNSQSLAGVRFRAHCFTPLLYHVRDAKYAGELCRGVEMHIHDTSVINPVAVGVTMLYTIRDLFPDKFQFNKPYHEKGKPMIDYNTGNAYIREGSKSLDEVLALYEKESARFATIKKPYELYK